MGLEEVDRIIKNIVLHLWSVFTHKLWILFYLSWFCAKLMWRALTHDLSKLRPIEVRGFIQVIDKFKTTEYGTPEYKALLDQIQPSLDAHYEVNRHHPEYHRQYLSGVEGMSLVDIVEMLCDWQASVRRTKNGDIQESIFHNKRRHKIEEQLACVLRNSVR